MNLLKEKIKAGGRLCGTHVSLAEPSLCEIIGNLGFDFIWIDMEHSYLSCKDVIIHANAARTTGTPVIVRVPQHDLTYTKRVLEMGVEGIIFPMVKNAEEMNELLSFTLYPPYGARGFGPQRAIGYGYEDVNAYIGKGHIHDFCRFIQIEHIDAVKDIEAIASNPYLDGVFFGPNDLSGSINQLLKVYEKDTADLICHAIEVLKKHGKAIGVSTGSTDEKVLRYWQSMGIQILSAGADYGYVLAGASDLRAKLNAVQKEDKDVV